LLIGEDDDASKLQCLIPCLITSLCLKHLKANLTNTSAYFALFFYQVNCPGINVGGFPEL